MLFLISDVTHDLGHVGLVDTECAVSRLPLESATQSAALVQPSGGIRLDNPDRVGEGQSRREPQEQVNMVCRSISSQQFASQFPHDAADVSQQIGLEFGVNQGEPVFGAEHDVEEQVREGLGHDLSPRRGAGIGTRCCPTCPRAHALGYVITPLRGWTWHYAVGPGVRTPALELVSDLPQELFSDLNVRFPLDTLGLHAVNDSEYSAALLGLRHDNFHRVRRCAIDLANFRHALDGVQNVKGETALHKNNETMPACQLQGVLLGEFGQPCIVSREADERRARRLAEPDPELHSRDGLHDSLVEVLHSLDKVRLAQDEVQVRWLVNFDCLQFHGGLQK